MSRASKTMAFLVVAAGAAALASPAFSSGGSAGGSTADTIKVGKNYWCSNSTLLISASSSNASAHLYLYTGSGTYIGEVQNGGGGRYGGSVFWRSADPVTLTLTSSAGGSVTFATAPFQF